MTEEKTLEFGSGTLQFNPKPTKIFPILFHLDSDMTEKLAGPIVGIPNQLEIAATVEGDKLVLLNWKGERAELRFK